MLSQRDVEGSAAYAPAGKRKSRTRNKVIKIIKNDVSLPLLV
tara:strand:+ start:95 stop:220 length:126 start_codon:yes stop_codon:yes gene_type:complete